MVILRAPSPSFTPHPLLPASLVQSLPGRIFKGIANEFAVGNFTATTFGCVLGEDKRVNRSQKKREVEEEVEEEEEDNRGG